ncbi:hypothetical protein [Caulobacter sp.]|nr:hypothetical protein [Caulobacter sp.]
MSLDAFGRRPISTTDASLTVSQQYDALGQMTSETGGVGT